MNKRKYNCRQWLANNDKECTIQKSQSASPLIFSKWILKNNIYSAKIKSETCQKNYKNKYTHSFTIIEI